MADLGEHEVSAMACALGMTLMPEDLSEVTHRLNAFIDALVPLRDLPLAGAEPHPAPIHADGAL